MSIYRNRRVTAPSLLFIPRFVFLALNSIFTSQLQMKRKTPLYRLNSEFENRPLAQTNKRKDTLEVRVNSNKLRVPLSECADLKSDLIGQTSAATEYMNAIQQSWVLFSFKKMCTEKLQLVHFQNTENYLKDNEFIIKGYRMGYSYAQSWISLFRVHNETVWLGIL